MADVFNNVDKSSSTENFIWYRVVPTAGLIVLVLGVLVLVAVLDTGNGAVNQVLGLCMIVLGAASLIAPPILKFIIIGD